MKHEQAHPMAGKTTKVKADVHVIGGNFVKIEDWWDRIAGTSWMNCDGNPACLEFAMRSAVEGLPIDDEVVYGKINGSGLLIHESELEE